jgi:hypothetical protein
MCAQHLNGRMCNESAAASSFFPLSSFSAGIPAFIRNRNKTVPLCTGAFNNG